MLRSLPGRKSLRFVAGLLGVVAVGMFIAAAAEIFQQPQTYRALADHGVPALARVRCAHGGCDLAYTFAGRQHTNHYANDLRQFCTCATATRVLVDPSDPATMFTVHDVQHGTNAGIGVGSVMEIIIGLGLSGLAGFALLTLRKLPSGPPPPPPPPPGPDASPLARSLYATDALQEQLDQAYALPGYTWYRVDRGKLAAGVEELRRNIIGLPGPRAGALDGADRLAREVRAASNISVIGGARVRALELSEQLDQLRLTIIDAVRNR